MGIFAGYGLLRACGQWAGVSAILVWLVANLNGSDIGETNTGHDRLRIFVRVDVVCVRVRDLRHPEGIHGSEQLGQRPELGTDRKGAGLSRAGCRRDGHREALVPCDAVTIHGGIDG